MTSSVPHDPAPALGWRGRRDLQITPMEFDGLPSWSIKDPLTLNYFQLREEEFFVWNRLDGQSSADKICTAFNERFRPRTLSIEEVVAFVGQLATQGLIVPDKLGYGRMLVARDRAAQSSRRWSKLTNVLAIRFRGIDPDRFLNWLLSRIGWLFSPGAVMAGLALILLATSLVSVQFDTLIRKLPDSQALLTASNLIWLSVVLAVIKVLHEFGHALTCKKFGGECHELGVMLFVFTPTLYCNVSDIWMIPDKWKRIAVSAAGMWVEAVIAATCTLLWWFSSPGLFHTLCLNVMIVCGVSTFIFNGNPLLRYDGYFVLADWLEIPNLQQQASAAVRNRLARWYGLHDERGAQLTSAHREWLLIAYGIASNVYRVMLTLLILWSLHHWLHPKGLEPLVHVLAAFTIGMIVLTPILGLIRYVRSPAMRAAMNWFRFSTWTAATTALLVLLLNVPLPCRIVAGALLDQDTAQPVYVTFPGMLVSGAKVGDPVNEGDIVARLVQPEFELEQLRVEGEVRQLRVRLEQFELRRVLEPEIAQAIPTLRESLRDLESQLKHLHESSDRLILKAPASGTILPPPRQLSAASLGTLPQWTGSPLDERNIGCYLRSGTIVCLVGSSESLSALTVINQNDISLIKVGQTVHFRWNELAGEVVTGKVTEVAALDLEFVSRDVIARLGIPARLTASGNLRPVDTWYQARVRLNAFVTPLPRCSSGNAEILAEPQSLWNRSLRWLSRTFSV